MADFKKREIAHKIKIGDLLLGVPIIEDVKVLEKPEGNGESFNTTAPKERFRFLELRDKKIIRVNVIANIVDKYISEGDKKFLTFTIDDASGQIRIKVFGEDVVKYQDLSQGDTIIVIGVLRSYNQELYISPEIIKKADTRYLLVRKLELEKNTKQIMPKPVNPEQKKDLKDEIIEIIRTGDSNGGVSTEDIILKIKTASPESINAEIIRLLEDGMVYEPRPGRVRYLG
jgi:RecG-like helicase